MEYQLGKIYTITHRRKGSFGICVTGQCEEWLHGVVAEGTARAMLDYNVKENGDEITVSKLSITSAVELGEVA